MTETWATHGLVGAITLLFRCEKPGKKTLALAPFALAVAMGEKRDRSVPTLQPDSDGDT